MKKRFYFLLLWCSLTISAQSVQVATEDATIDFTFLDGNVDGTLSEFQFTGSINLSQLTSSVFSGTVATKTLDTDNWLRSRHLRGKKFFNASEYPQLRFNGKTTRVDNGVIIVQGALTIKGILRDVVFRFKQTQNTFIGKTAINTQDYDISVYDKRDRNVVDIKITIPYRVQ